MKNILLASFIIFFTIASPLQAETVSTEHDLQKAFFKEYSFLIKEKKAMKKRLASLKSQMAIEKTTMQSELETLQLKNNSLELKIDRLNENIALMERESITNESNKSIFDTTLEQASATLTNNGEKNLTSIKETVNKGLLRLKNNTSLSTVTGNFYLQDGQEVTGEIIHLGAIARFGINTDDSYSLAPVGGGEFKAWLPVEKAVMIEQLRLGIMPDTIELLLFESAMKEVKSATEKTVLSIINSGGMIAWIIVFLGAVATLFALIRGFFLLSLGRNSKKKFAQISTQVSEDNIENAKQIAASAGGSLKRVMLATLNNIHRDREHVEDTIAEAILHENTKLDRFHSLIMVIAAISPLLGLLGTVTGMIETFDVITEFGTGDPKLLSGGISIALVTTELGLIVAIPVLVVGTLLASWGNKVKDDIEKSALHIVNQYQNQLNKNSL